MPSLMIPYVSPAADYVRLAEEEPAASGGAPSGGPGSRDDGKLSSHTGDSRVYGPIGEGEASSGRDYVVRELEEEAVVSNAG